MHAKDPNLPKLTIDAYRHAAFFLANNEVNNYNIKYNRNRKYVITGRNENLYSNQMDNLQYKKGSHTRLHYPTQATQDI